MSNTGGIFELIINTGTADRYLDIDYTKRRTKKSKPKKINDTDFSDEVLEQITKGQI